MSRFDKLLEKGKYSAWFQAKYDPESYDYNMALSERQLFVQSNARVLLGQDNMGRMHFLAVPHEKDYALPTCRTSAHSHITACPGMYYQTDLTLFLGKAFYQMESKDGSILRNGNEGSITRYLNDFLPWTSTTQRGVRMDTFSIAPVLEYPYRPGLKTLPLPGPSGMIYGMRVKNEGEEIWQGKATLMFANQFMSKYEHCGEAVETRAYPAQYSQVDRNLLLMSRPEGYTGLYMKDGFWRQKDGSYYCEREICLKPGEEILLETLMAVSEKADGISEAMSLLYMHDSLEWIGITDCFWKKYLGSLSVEIEGEEILSGKARDMHVRNILDDFNCIQMDAGGSVLVHWQGAPSHCMGRLWGIDVEPTTLSFIHMFPEMGEKLIEYMVERNEPRYAEYPEHSVPIMMAPLVMAGEYYTYTGNKDYFLSKEYVMKRLDEIWEKIVAFCKEGFALVPSRYSSDGKVMRRYDHGTNVKFWYASQCYGTICKALGREKAGKVFAYAERLKADIQNYMLIDGPFGKQISGGTNLGEQEDFYMDEDFTYYDGEDSSSVLAPVYGIYDFSYEPWVNYHRYARSLFCSNYEPEMDVLRWFPYGGALDGTAYVSQLGGSLTKQEMKHSLENMINSAVDDTGSLYWWPKAENMRRMIARCSQGQGSWIVQFMKQWLGIRFDAENKVLNISPRGLLNGFCWEGAYLGGYCFDISYCEGEEKSSITVKNYTCDTFRVVFGCRPYGAGAQGEIDEVSGTVLPGEELVLERKPVKTEDTYFSVVEQELAHFADSDGILLNHFGFKQACMDAHDKQNIFLLPFVLSNKNPEPLENVRLVFQVPACMRTKEKTSRIWDDARNMQREGCEICRNLVRAGERTVIAVWVEADAEYDASNVWFDGHPFMEEEKRKEGKLWMASEKVRLEDELTVTLKYERAGKSFEKVLNVPVGSMPEEELKKYTMTFLGALSE